MHILDFYQGQSPKKGAFSQKETSLLLQEVFTYTEPHTKWGFYPAWLD